MSKHEMLNNIAHKDLRVITRKSAEFGDNVTGALIFPEEFMAVQREYPIFFQKDPETGAFQAVAMFGFRENENLFLDENGWHANYIPAVMEREPFLIGFKPGQAVDTPQDPVILIDMDSPRISQGEEGERLFLELGGNSAHIDRINKMLLLIHEGLQISKNMFAAFLALDLIEPFTLNIEFTNGERHVSQAFYTINQERFFDLNGEALEKLHRTGYLHYAYMVIVSLGNVQKLIDLRQKQLK